MTFATKKETTNNTTTQQDDDVTHENDQTNHTDEIETPEQEMARREAASYEAAEAKETAEDAAEDAAELKEAARHDNEADVARIAVLETKKAMLKKRADDKTLSDHEREQARQERVSLNEELLPLKRALDDRLAHGKAKAATPEEIEEMRARLKELRALTGRNRPPGWRKETTELNRVLAAAERLETYAEPKVEETPLGTVTTVLQPDGQLATKSKRTEEQQRAFDGGYETVEEMHNAERASKDRASSSDQARKRQEGNQKRQDNLTRDHIAYIRKNPPAPTWEHYDAWVRVYRPHEDEDPTPDKVRERIEGELNYGVPDKKTGMMPITPLGNVDAGNAELVCALDPVLHLMGTAVYGGGPTWRGVLPPWAKPARRKRFNDFRANALQMDDNDLAKARRRLRTYWKRNMKLLPEDYAKQCVKDRIDETDYDAQQDRLRNHLPEWDRGERMHDPIGAGANEVEQEMWRNFLLGMVHRNLNPGAQMDNIMVLVGGQGTRKTSFVRALTAGWFASITLLDVPRDNDPDGLSLLHMSPVINLDEIDRVSLRTEGSKNGTDATLKLQTTNVEDTWRTKYATLPVTRPRPSVMMGTTNDMNFIGDATGHRRFWPVHVREVISEEYLTQEHIDQVLAEVMYHYNEGERADFAKMDALTEDLRDSYVSEGTGTLVKEYLDQHLDMAFSQQPHIAEAYQDDVRHPDVSNIDVAYVIEVMDLFGDASNTKERSRIRTEVKKVLAGHKRYTVEKPGGRKIYIGDAEKTKNVTTFWRRKPDEPGKPMWGPESLPDYLLPLPENIAGWGFVTGTEEDGATARGTTIRGWVPTADSSDSRPKHPDFNDGPDTWPTNPDHPDYEKGQKALQARKGKSRWPVTGYERHIGYWVQDDANFKRDPQATKPAAASHPSGANNSLPPAGSAQAAVAHLPASKPRRVGKAGPGAGSDFHH